MLAFVPFLIKRARGHGASSQFGLVNLRNERVMAREQVIHLGANCVYD